MPNLYQGVDTSYPADIHTPADGEDCDESILDLPHQQTADRTAWLKRRMLLSPVGIDVAHSVDLAADQNFGACFVPGYDELWVVGEGSGADARTWKSTSMGRSFARETAVDAVLVANPTHQYGIAANEIGDLIIVGSAAHCQSYERATDTWFADGWASVGSWTRIVYLPTLDQFVVVGVTGANLTGKRTDPADIHNMLAPTTQIGGGGTWSNFTTGLAVNPTTGRVVAVGLSTGAPRVAYTTDGGDNWTTIAALVTGVASADYVDVAYGGDGYFYLTVGDSVLHESEVWRSADGITWTLRVALANEHVRQLAGFGERLVGVTGTNRGALVVSHDGGATWTRTGARVTGTPLKIENVYGRAVICTSTRVETTHYLGSDESAATLA